MQSLRCMLAVAAIFSFAAVVRAENLRRPGLDGRWSGRHLTTPHNSLKMIAGPGEAIFLGDRFAEQIVDAGPQFVRPSVGSDEWWLRFGVGFGLTKDWEAGAMFLPFRLAPSFDFSQITVFVTRGFRYENFDFGIRLTFQTPRPNKDDMRVWILNPGIPIVFRSDFLRLDAGFFLPFATREWTAGATVPARVSVSLNPHVFFGVETGFAQKRFDYESDWKIPLGFLAGYTALFGGRVLDFTGMFSWDSFLSPNADEASDLVDAESFRVGFGFTIHSIIR